MKIPMDTINMVKAYLVVSIGFDEPTLNKFIASKYFNKWYKDKHMKYLIDDAIEDFRANTKYLDNNLVEYF